MSRTGDQQASNAIVSGVSFYAGALQRAHEETAHYERLVHVLSEEKQTRDNEFKIVTNERNELCNHALVLNGQIETLAKQVQDERLVVAAERRRCNDLSREKGEVESKLAKLMTENERLQRVNIESHNERDKNVRAMQASAEALGWLKSEANQFVVKLRGFIEDAEFLVESPSDVLHAVARLSNHWNATGGDEAFKKQKPNPKRRGLPPANNGQ